MNVVLVLFAIFAVCDAGTPSLRGDPCRIAVRFAAFLEEDINQTKGIGDIPDPSCKEGVVSPDLKACCTDKCGSCGNHPLCDDEGKFNEKTGKLADNCCKDRVLKKAASCDKTHPPCVLSSDYAKELDTYKIERPKRHAMDDCNKAIEMARAKHSLGIEKGEFLSRLFLEGRTKYEDALDIAVKVIHLVEKKIHEISEEEQPIKEKMAACTAADKEVDPMTGTSKYGTLQDELESNENQVNFYNEITKNAKAVKGSAAAGIKAVDDLKEQVIKVRDIEPFKLKLDSLVDDATKVYREAEQLWKQWVDSGKDYECGAPPAVEHVASQCTNGNTKYSFKCAITCEEGFDGNGSKNALSCLKQGKFGKQLYGEWQGMASCVGRDCGEPPVIAKAKTNIASIRYPNVAHYHCHEGYSVNSKADAPKAFSVECGAQGNFLDNHSHKCEKIKCGAAPAYANTESVSGVYYYADVVTYHCLEGHTLDEQPGGIANFTASCLASGMFATNQQCKRVRCGPPPDFEHTIEKGEGNEKYFGDEVFFECRAGYSTDQSPNGVKEFTLECGASGEFKVKGASSALRMPQCQPVSAGMSPKIDHGNLPPREMFFGQEAWVSADVGFSYLAKPKEGVSFLLSVTPEGTYSNVHKFKPVECGAPPTVTKSVQNFKTSLAVYGDVLPYTCEDGYSTTGIPEHQAATTFALVCESDGDFSKVPDKGECVNIDDCLEHTCGPHGACEDLLLDYKCNCDSGFEQVVDEDSNEKLCGNINDCGAEACGVGKCKDLINAYSCICPTGYEETGDGPMDKTCSAKICGVPPEVQHCATSPVEAQIAKASYSDDILYQCDEGYTTDGMAGGKNHFSIKCQADTSFTETQTCEPVQCGPADKVEKATAKPSEVTFNKTITYKCEEGHSIDGTNEGDKHFSVVCQATGEYTDVQECLPVTCGEPVEVANAFVESGPVFFPQTRGYKCFDGFTLDGKSDSEKTFEVECKASGELTKAKQCLAVVCGEPPKFIHALYATASNEGAVSYPQISEVTCRDGYTVGGSASGDKSFGVRCLANGKFSWKSKASLCDSLSCATVKDGYPDAGKKVCCPEGMHTIGDGSACQGGGMTECKTYGNPELPQCPPANCEAPTGCSSSCTTIHSGYKGAGTRVCCPEGMETYGDGSACQGGGKPNCKTYGNPGLPLCSSMAMEGLSACQAKCSSSCTTIHSGYKGAGSRVCCPEGMEKYGDGSACKGGGKTTCKTYGNPELPLCPSMAGEGVSACEAECEPVRCGPVPDLKNAKLKGEMGTTLSFDETATYECLPGFTAGGEYDARSSFVAECLASGELSYPAADMQCRNVDACQQHTCGPRGTCIDTIGESINAYTCNCSYGFAVKMVKGEKFCGNIDDCGEHKCGDGVCKDLIGDYTCICPAGHYVGYLNNEKTCVPVRCADKVPVVKNGKMLSDHKGPVDFPLSLRYECDSGYSTDGSVADAKRKFHANCKADGTLYGMGSCQKITCGTPLVIHFTTISGTPSPTDSVEFKEKVTYKCIDGYYIGGSAEGKTEFQTECQANGDLTDPQVCDPVNCGAPPVVEHAHPHIAPEVYFGMSLEYFCASGYSLDGTVDGAKKFPRRCLAHGEFEALNSPKPCKAITAGELPTIPNARIAEYNGRNDSHFELPITAYYPDGVEYHCLSGFTLTGGSDGQTKFAAIVNAQGQLQPPLPEKCLPITYSAFGLLKNSRNGAGLNGAVVTLVGTSLTGTSDSRGYVRINEIPPGRYNVKFTMSGYIDVERMITIRSNIAVGGVMDVSMSPAMADDQWRAVLKWNAQPTDLDTYAKWGYSKVCWYGRRKHGGNMQGVLEKDDTNGFGPETLFLSNVGKCRGSSQACDIKYLINDYTRSKTMLEKGAEVTLYTGSRVEGSWKISDCPTSVYPDKNWWHVFTIDGRTNQMKWNCKEPPNPPITPGINEEVFYFTQDKSVPILNSRKPDLQRVVYQINYPSRRNNWPGLSRANDFAVRWEGSIRINRQGTYTFYLRSDDGSKFWMDEDLMINNGGLHGMQTKTATTSLPSALHAIKIDYFERGGGAGCVFKYKGPDTNNRVIVVPQRALRVNPVLGGLTEEAFYFDQGDRLPDLNTIVPNLAREVDTVNYERTEGKFPGFARIDNFAIRWTGFVIIHVTGEYVFTIGSDDGSKLWIRDEQLINDDGLHNFQEKSGTKTLDTDYHRLRMEYFEKDGFAAVSLKYKGPDTNGELRIIPKENLRKAAGTPRVIDLYAGLKETVFHFSGNPENNGDSTYHMPRYNGRTPNKVGVVDFVNYAETSNKWGGYSVENHYAVRFTGSMIVKRSGRYGLKIGSDDGSMLWWSDNTEPLINNGGLHGFNEKSAETDITKDRAYAIRLDYFENGGGAGCKFWFKGADTSNQWKIVPRRNLLSTSPLTGLTMEAFYLNEVIFMENDKREEIKGRDTGESIKSMQKWGIYYEEAESKCLDNPECKAFCNNPSDWSTFFPSYDQGFRYVGDYGYGFKCYRIKGYEGNTVPDDVDRKPAIQRRVTSVDFADTSNKWSGFRQAIDFSVRFTGSIVIHHAGSYAFWIGSDDGSVLYMGDTYETLIDNDGLHGYREKEATKDMVEGETAIMIRYFQHDGNSALRWFWQGQDTDNKKVIVGSTGGAGVMRRIAGPP